MSTQTMIKEENNTRNGVNVDELFNTIDAVKKAPVIAKFSRPCCWERAKDPIRWNISSRPWLPV
jgi:hypothetical protein